MRVCGLRLRCRGGGSGDDEEDWGLAIFDFVVSSWFVVY
jgi:hypothetical protein